MNFAGDLFSDSDEMPNQASVSPSLLEVFKAFQDEISGRIPPVKDDQPLRSTAKNPWQRRYLNLPRTVHTRQASKAPQELRKLLCIHSVSLLVVLEPMIDTSSFLEFQQKLGFEFGLIK